MTTVIRLACLLTLGAFALPGAVRITEFMAQNDGGLRDQDSDSPDWVELRNDGAAGVELAGWHLTDDAANLSKWAFPAAPLASGGYLVVFASGKNRASSGAELHTSFQLNQAGGWLGLVAPDGTTIVDSITYPTQRANMSFGVGRQVNATTLLATGAAARFFVPSNNLLGLGWTAPDFDDSAWASAATPLAFNTDLSPTVLLSVDVNERGTGDATNTMPGFVSFLINSSASSTAIQTQATTRVFGGISVTVSNTAPLGYDDRLRATPADSGTFTEGLLLRDFLFSRDNAGSGGLDVTVGGLATTAPHRFTVWSFDSGSPGNRVSDWSANGVAVTNGYAFGGATLPSSNAQYRFTFDATASPAGHVLISGRRNAASVDGSGAASFGVFLNALQISVLAQGSATNTLGSLMLSNNASAFVRLPFIVNDPALVSELVLRMRYDDGFVAWLNGRLIASNNAPSVLAWNSSAVAPHSGGGSEDFVVIPPPDLLVAGTNLLAVQALNVNAGDPDLFLEPQILARQVSSAADRFFSPPTPGTDNDTGYADLVADTKFSVNRGFYDASFLLSITSATADAQIWFTTNGSAPSPTNGFLFNSPIGITGQSFIRAAAFLVGWVPSDVDTHSYLFLRDVLRQSNNIPNYPVTWQASYPADYGMDSNIVRHPVYGATISNDLRSIPSLCIVSDHNGLWNSSTGIYPNPTSVGSAWERPASLELIRGDGRTEFATTCKIQLHGNASRDNNRTPKHAFGLAFNSDYGPARLRYDWFGGGVEVHDKIVLRNCGFVDGWAGRYADESFYTSSETGESFRGLRYRPENTCFLRDAWVKDSFRAMGWAASRSQFVHLYLNGLYWGLYEPSEHLDASYFSLLHGGQEGAWDVLVGEDNNGPPVIVDGSVTDWQNVLNIVNAGITNEVAYQAVAQRVDLDNLIDYMIIHIFAESEDWPRHNWYVAHRRATNGVPGTRFICTVWDQELTLDRLVRRNRVEVGGVGGEVYGPARVYQQLRAWPEFRRQFGDRVHKHLFNNGALMPTNNVVRLLASAAIIRDALVGESARWGDARRYPTPGSTNGTGQTFTRDEWWQPEIDKLATNFFQKLTADNVARFRTGNLYPALGGPELNQFGGGVPAGFLLEMRHTNATGTIYFTVDGTDPRQYGTGAVAPAAQAFEQPVTLNSSTLVRARILNGAEWSALVEATFYPPQDLSRLALTEIMYNPPGLGTTNGDEFEFVELKNTGTNSLDLSGLSFTEGILFTFTNPTVLAPGQFFVLVRNEEAFAGRYPGVAIGGVYSGRLDNGGEPLTMSHPVGGTVLSVTYNDLAPWPVTPDSLGFSLVQRADSTSPAPDDGAAWRASINPGGSPGADDPPSVIPPIVINEVLSASVPPRLDAIELFNPTSVSVDIGGWFLTDDPGAPKKFRIPDGTLIAAGGFAVFDETQFNPTPGINVSFALNGHGDDVYLFSGDAHTNLTGYSHGFSFDAAAADVSFGRYLNSVGQERFPAQVSLTFSNANAGPRVGPVVINEIHYHPPLGGDEFVELSNITGVPVPLFDETCPSNTWRLSGIGFDFPMDVTLPPGGLALLVAIYPADFIAKYNVPTSVPVFGPYFGSLQASGERLQLERPAPFSTNGIFYIVLDQVRYNDKAPWPPAADGGGSSLQRLAAAAYGDDPSNWLAAPPTPGLENAALDTDGDGLPDAWEIANGTNPADNDASADPDHDGATNLQECLAGTNPLDPNSVLRLTARPLSKGADGVALSFLAAPERSYTVQFRDSLEAGLWERLADVAAAPSNRIHVLTNTLSGAGSRFYRLVTPTQP